MNYTNDDRLKPLCSLRQRTRREKYVLIDRVIVVGI